ncbi:ribosome small subunit-dependent GTPase A [Anaerostipes sp. 494a]|uniref:ribosome small subunit-dependent GTPase A n=1 Tax=Anaerostipes TaxID=207244 RepID=UPI00095179B0|nr:MULTISPECIES: ribosome small subunit-dependent GTPase A [Anaerostipes]MCI5622368.1 ribosome small subunit-dependent GTPase A [Anaerostipes sp.]MDY2727262.1 ribosome small subunit-dependent GTPase A [Anaerostipes faecalis]OLR59157.1 ribosome small subunit-dependent GTPase A [Anaerostipes sp. 494a]
MQGKIIKGIAGFYYVQTGDKIYQCKAKGIFRNKKIKPLVGDNVDIDILDETDLEGNITEILPRTNELIRPAVANVDQALVVFAARNPKPNYNLLDRFLMMMEKQQIPVIVCFNKMDLAKEKELALLDQTYENCGHKVMFISVRKEEGIEEIRNLIRGKTTVLAGPSGVGKSSLMNLLQPEANMETGAVSEKIKRGKHTTRHSELICIEENTFVLDTPGFSSLFIHTFEEDEIREYFQEFTPYEGQCRFQGCSHTHEPDCGVKKALEEGKISQIRYDNYVNIYTELKEKRKW